MPRTERQAPHEEVLEVLRERDREVYPVMKTTDVAEHFDVTRRTINTRLRELNEDGKVYRHEIGGTPVWWLPGEKMIHPEEIATPDEEGDDVDDTPDEERVADADGGAVDAVPREVTASVEEQIKQVAKEAAAEGAAEGVREYEEEKTREESGDTIDTWGEQIERDAKLTVKAGVVGLLLFGGAGLMRGLLLAYIPGALEGTVPLLNTSLSDALVTVAALAGTLPIAFFPFAAVAYALVLTGIPDALEERYEAWRARSSAISA